MLRRFTFLFLLLPLLAAAADIPSPGDMNELSWLTQSLNALMSTTGNIFVADAQMILHRFGGLMLALVALNIIWESLGGRSHLSFPQLRTFVFWYVIAVVMLDNWDTFRHMFTDTAAYMQSRVDFSTLDLLNADLDDLRLKIYQPSMWDPTSYIPYYATLGIFYALLGLMDFTTSFGLIAMAAGGIIGPLLVMTLPFPRFQGYAWGWIHAMIKYAFYGVLGSAVVNIAASVLVHYLDNGVHGLYTSDNIEALLPGLVKIALLVVLTVLKIPHLVSDFTSGSASAGSGVGGGLLSFIPGLR